MATSGPASAPKRYGVRCQRITSINALEAISVNGRIVQRTFDRISRTYLISEPDAAIAAVTSRRFTE